MTTSKENALTEIEIDRFLNACETKKDKTIAIILLYSGLRVSEFAHMKKTWVNWQEQTINIPERQECTCNDCKARGFWKPKTKNGVRSIPMRHEIRLQEAVRSFFALHDSVNMQRTTIWRRIKKIAEKAGIEHRIYPHALRATSATIFGHLYSVPTVCYIMGWGLLKTGEYYVQSTKRRAMEEVETVARRRNGG